MENGSCFGKWYSGEARECRLCDVRKECTIAMQDEKKMPCFGDYDSDNYACTVACHLGGEDAEKSVCAASIVGTEVPSDKLTEVEPVEEKVEVEAQVPIDPAAAEQVVKEVAESVGELAEEVTEPVEEESSSDAAKQTEAAAEDTGATVSPDEVQAKPGKKKSKKDIIREALRGSPDGITADDIVTLIMDAGLASAADADKTRHYVIMSISQLRRTGKTLVLREGKYVLTGDQSE